MLPVLLECDGLGGSRINLSAAPFDLGAPRFLDPLLRFTIETAEQLERQARAPLPGA
jgi:hypothetical protein